MDMRPDPYESRLDKLSISPRMPQSEYIWSCGSHHKLTLSSSPNPALPKRVGFNLYLSLGQSVIVAWWRMMGIHGTGPQSTSLVLHAFHVCSIIFLIHVCISENDNERTSWRSINSSNVSNTIIIKNDFTFESNVSNVVVSEKVMSSSLDDRLPPLVHPIALSPHASHWTHLLVSLIWHIAPTCVDLSVLKTLLSKPSRAQIAPFGLRQLPLQQYRIIRCYLTSLYLIFVWILHWPYPIIFHTFCIGPTRSFSIPDPIIKSGFTTLLPL